MQNRSPFQAYPALFTMRQNSFGGFHPSIIKEDMPVALVLSSGGAFGAYQAGAWEVLEEFLQPDIVVGTSIGSLHAWAIAGGATSAQLKSLWYDASLAHAIRWQLPRRLRHGLLDHQHLEPRIQTMHRSFTPNRPVAVVANRYPHFRPHLFRNEEITWEHLAASCAVPLFLRQPEIDGFTHADGGILDSINLWAAFAMGATSAVIVNCWKPKQPWLLEKSVGWLAARRRESQRREYQRSGKPQVSQQNRVVLIEPELPLGRLRDGVYWKKPYVDDLIARGRADALRHKQFICDMF